MGVCPDWRQLNLMPRHCSFRSAGVTSQMYMRVLGGDKGEEKEHLSESVFVAIAQRHHFD